MLKARAACLATLAMATVCTTSSAGATPLTFFSRPGSAAPFSPAVRAGDFIFVSGQIGASGAGKLPDTVEEQGRLAMENIQNALTMAGTDFAHVVKCTVMMEDMREWQAFNKVYVTYFQSGRLPARSAFGTNGLALSAKVEVECIAYHPLAQRR